MESLSNIHQPRERERERISYESIFYSKFTKGQYVGRIYGFPMQRGQWCTSDLKTKVLARIAKGHIRELILPYPQEKETDREKRRTDYRLPTYDGCMVQHQTQGKSSISTGFSSSSLAQGADTNIVQYLGIAADEPERIERHKGKPGIVLPLVDIGWNEAYCRQWCEENDLLSPIYTNTARGGCWFCHNQGIDQLRLLRKEYPELWELLLKWDWDSPVTFHPDGRTVHDFDLRFYAEDLGLVPADRKFRWKVLDNPDFYKEDK